MKSKVLSFLSTDSSFVISAVIYVIDPHKDCEISTKVFRKHVKLFLPHKDWLPQSLQQKYFREHVKSKNRSTEGCSKLKSPKLFLPHKDWVPQSFQQKWFRSTLKLFLPHKDWVPQSFQQKYFREHVKTLLPHKDWVPQSFQQKYFREHVKTLPSSQR